MSRKQLSTGVSGLDEILDGGLPAGRLYLLRGPSGTGKTTLGLQFLLAAPSESCLFVTLSQTEDELEEIAASHGWSLEGVEIMELSQRSLAERLADDQQLFTTADVELEEIGRSLRERIERVEPERLVFDSIGALRILAGDRSARYRDQILATQVAMRDHGTTALFLDDQLTAAGLAVTSEALAHGILDLSYDTSAFGADRRRLRVSKMRGLAFDSGFHDFTIRPGGMAVYPRPRRIQTSSPASPGTPGEVVESGVAGLDSMLGGGLERGTSCLILGTAGTGKTTLSSLYLNCALQQGEKALVFVFEENEQKFLRRARALGLGLDAHIESGKLAIRAIDTAEISPGEFGHLALEAVRRGTGLVVIDSLTGYFNSIQDQTLLVPQLRELLNHLSRQGALTLMTVAEHGLIGQRTRINQDISYIADSVIALRFFEQAGRVSKAVSVIKKRFSDHEKSIRELRIERHRIDIGEPILDFRGVLSGDHVTVVDHGRDAGDL